MFRRTLFVALALGLIGSANAARTLEMQEGAYEVVLADVRFPGSTAGTLIIRTCATCDPIALTVSSATSYVGTTGPMTLADFLDDVERLRASERANRTTGVGVYFELGSTRVTRVSLYAGALNGQ
jgi:hypothetical protein